MTDAWLGFFGGLLAALVGGVIASFVQRQNEAKRRRDEARHAVYMKLMDLNSQYFWVASAELQKEKAPESAVIECRKTSWEVANLLRQCDQVEYLDEILELLFSVNINSANERANRLDALLDKLGKLVNPAYAEHITRISQANVISLGMNPKTTNNAPGSWRLPG